MHVISKPVGSIKVKVTPSNFYRMLPYKCLYLRLCNCLLNQCMAPCTLYIMKITLSHKLRFSTGISGPEKSRNNVREKISYFFTCVDIANQLLTRHSPLAPLGQVDEYTAKPSRFSI